ncbi:MAG TPA: MgtC/SapB family protein [Candidatus Paceibacterota bacterium]|jgi:putative Mg2+ transporter-C (MgtC) family protein|nr:MgtC/SapB family protein [Candidatus Paceibacterota bacterium]
MYQFIAQNSEIILRLTVAVLLGLLVGAERLLVHKDAGMKTHALVSMGSALFVIISEMMVENYINLPGLNPTMIPAQIVVGIGFLGAGSIMLYGSQLRGLTTAGGLWVMAGIGMAAGFGFFGLAIVSTVLVLLVFTVVNIFERPIRKMNGEIEEPKRK